MMWSAQWQQYATAFAQQAFAEKRAREQAQASQAAKVQQWITQQRQLGQTDEQIKIAIFTQWKAKNRQANANRKLYKQEKCLTLSEMPIFKKLHWREKKRNE